MFALPTYTMKEEDEEEGTYDSLTNRVSVTKLWHTGHRTCPVPPSVPGSMRILTGLLVVASCSAAEVNYAPCASAKASPPGPGGRKLTLLAGQILHSSGSDGSKDAKPVPVPVECGTLSGIPQAAAGGDTLTDVSIAFYRLKSRRQPSLGQLILLQVRARVTSSLSSLACPTRPHHPMLHTPHRPHSSLAHHLRQRRSIASPPLLAPSI